MIEEEMEEQVALGNLASMLQPDESPGPEAKLKRRQGVVSAIAAGPPPTLTVTIGGTAVAGVRYFDWYLPTVGDVVFLDFDGATPVVVGKLAGAAGGGSASRGRLAPDVGSPTSSASINASVGTTEVVIFTTAAVQTYAGREVDLKALIHYIKGSTNAMYFRLRRGTTTGGAELARSEPVGAAGLKVPTVLFYSDAPGAQAAQQWVLTAAADTGTGDVRNPSLFTVKEGGPS